MASQSRCKGCKRRPARAAAQRRRLIDSLRWRQERTKPRASGWSSRCWRCSWASSARCSTAGRARSAEPPPSAVRPTCSARPGASRGPSSESWRGRRSRSSPTSARRPPTGEAFLIERLEAWQERENAGLVSGLLLVTRDGRGRSVLAETRRGDDSFHEIPWPEELRRLGERLAERDGEAARRVSDPTRSRARETARTRAAALRRVRGARRRPGTATPEHRRARGGAARRGLPARPVDAAARRVAPRSGRHPAVHGRHPAARGPERLLRE